MWSRAILEGYLFVAHNAFFERCIYTNVLVKRYGWPPIPARQYRCTAAKAAACALPRNLEGAGEAMKLRVQKDKRGYVAMMATCKPTKKWNAWRKLQEKVAAGARITEKSRIKSLEPEPQVFLEPEDAPDTWQTLYTYCKIDVRTEEELDVVLPDLIPAEQEIWHLNQKLNWRGLRVDLPTVKKVIGIMEGEGKKKLTELDALTMGLVTKPGARKSILEFLALEGIELPDIRAKTVEDTLGGFMLTETARRLLEIRKALSMTSTKKFYAFMHRAMHNDDRVRDILMYHGASTGRDTGTGLMPHNFPRGLIKTSKMKPYQTVENVVALDPDMLRLIYGDSLGVLFSAILRNMILPSEGCELFVGDFSKIEVAVLWWLCDNKPGLKILRMGLDPYVYMAAKNLGMTYEEVKAGISAEETWALDARQLGKAQVLGNGFGMGADKFQDTAWIQYRLKLTKEQSKLAVRNYREANSRVPEVWKEYEKAAIEAVKSGRWQKAGKCTFFVKNKFLWIQLPSGRCLAYREPQVSWRVREYEVKRKVPEGMKFSEKDPTFVYDERDGCWFKIEKKFSEQETLEFWAVNSKTKKWNLERTWGGTLTENIVQATARDLLMGGMIHLERAGYKVLLSVHDEAVCEKPIGEGSVEEFTQTMCAPPGWAKGLPLEADGWVGPRYRK